MKTLKNFFVFFCSNTYHLNFFELKFFFDVEMENAGLKYGEWRPLKYRLFFSYSCTGTPKPIKLKMLCFEFGVLITYLCTVNVI